MTRNSTDIDAHISTAADGYGPLLQRDYWGVIYACRATPAELMKIVSLKFCELAPPQLVQFTKIGDDSGPMRVGDQLTAKIRLAGEFGVRVVHQDDLSLTIVTLEGHPEAGRITFGAYRNEQHDVVFHIRSRARSSSANRYLGFLAAGEPMQTSTWSEMINRVAASTGEGVVGFVHAQTTEVEETEADRSADCPTFRATES